MQKIFAWLDEYLLLGLTLFLVAFIPLWPKIPLIQPIPGYIVRIRLEDLFVGLTAIVYAVQLLRKKISIKTPLTQWMVFYVVIAFFSLLSAFFIIHTLPTFQPHVLKAFLHLFRYIEYFSLFFFAFSAVKKPEHAKWFAMVFGGVVIVAALYGFGQKYFRLPVYSTMNYEFSSGEALELVTSESRVQSTFAGHYDFAIYMSLLLPFILAFFYSKQTKKARIFTAIVFVFAIWSLIVSGLRIAFVSYMVMSIVVTAQIAMRQESWKEKSVWFLTRIVAVGGFTLLMFLVFGSNLQALLSHALSGLFGGASQTQSIDKTIISQYQLPVPKDQVEEYRINGGTKPQELSGCALEREISLCIRLESLWPEALRGFLRNSLLGSGYSSLNKRDFYHLSEADGTDNNYLRLLGETGLLGFLSFFGIILVAARHAFAELKKNTPSSLAIGFIGLLCGLLINALLFDVFAASKVAFGLWAITGVCLGMWKLEKSKTSKRTEKNDKS